MNQRTLDEITNHANRRIEKLLADFERNWNRRPATETLSEDVQAQLDALLTQENPNAQLYDPARG